MKRTVDEWIVEVFESTRASTIKAQNVQPEDEESSEYDAPEGAMYASAIKVAGKKDAGNARMASMLDLRWQYDDFLEKVGTDAKVYISFLLGYTLKELVELGPENWPDAPATEHYVRKAITRSRLEWDIRLRALGIQAPLKKED